MVRLNLSLGDVRNCKETTTFVKERKPQGILFENPKSPTSLEKCIKN